MLPTEDKISLFDLSRQWTFPIVNFTPHPTGGLKQQRFTLASAKKLVLS